MRRLEWKRCPSQWVLDESQIKSFHARSGECSANTASLMCLVAIIHAYDSETGIARLTTSDFERITSRSRTLIASGLRGLKSRQLITSLGQSNYMLEGANYESGWSKFPLRSMCSSGDTIDFFKDCTLRKRSELDALKLLFLFCALRDEADNRATISYDRIIERTGISRAHIKSALSLLAVHSLVYTEHKPSIHNELGIANCYRIRGVESRFHRGTRGRSDVNEPMNLITE